MSTPAWWSQPVAAEGYTASEGIRRQLGKPHLDPLTVLIRETAQNSCDAAKPGGADVEFAVRLHRLSGNRLDAWRNYLLPEPAGSHLRLAEAMARVPMIMTIADRGTTGLGGPLRADETPLPDERPDFVNFIRNVGERKTVDLGGGSYGFGKGILYNVSRCHIVVADSVCMYRGRLQRRLIGAALGDGYIHDGRRFTGRHWLGPLDGQFARPLLDAEAEQMATRLGLPRFEDGATGTTVTAVDIDLGRKHGSEGETPRDVEEAAEFVVSTMLWNLWPRMLEGRPNRLVCSMRHDGFITDVPNPEALIELRPFVDAYRALSDESRYEVPARKQPPQEIGRFSLARGMAPIRENPLLRAAAPFEGRAHHCARMRQTDLVVDYVAGETPSDEAVQYGAVFRASSAADQFFAEAEPPTHDDWVLTGLRGTARGVVQLAGGFVRERLRSEVQESPSTEAVGDTPLGFLASRLSGLVSGADGGSATASGPSSAGPRGGGRRASENPRFIEGPMLVEEGSTAVMKAVVRMPAWASTRRVLVQPQIVLDNGFEPPDSSLGTPTVIGWRSVDTGAEVLGDQLVLTREADRTWEVRVSPAQDAVVRLKVVVADEEERS